MFLFDDLKDYYYYRNNGLMISYDIKDIQNNFYFNRFTLQRLNYAIILIFKYFKYNSSIIEYKEFIKLIAKLTNELALKNNSISHSRIIALLIHNGYLSVDSVFKIPNSKSEELLLKDINNFLGIDVVNGRGYCRHVSDVHEKVFQANNLYGPSISCLTDSNTNYLSNHEINLIEYNDVLYAHDVINLEFYKVYDEFSLEAFNLCYDIDKIFNILYYIPRDDYIENKSKLDILTKIEKLRNNTKKAPISKQELDSIIEETNQRFKNSKSLLSDFKNETNEKIKSIIKHL